MDRIQVVWLNAHNCDRKISGKCNPRYQ